MIVLGINAYHADSSAAIFVDGEHLTEDFNRCFEGIPTAPHSINLYDFQLQDGLDLAAF